MCESISSVCVCVCAFGVCPYRQNLLRTGWYTAYLFINWCRILLTIFDLSLCSLGMFDKTEPRKRVPIVVGGIAGPLEMKWKCGRRRAARLNCSQREQRPTRRRCTTPTSIRPVWSQRAERLATPPLVSS